MVAKKTLVKQAKYVNLSIDLCVIYGRFSSKTRFTKKGKNKKKLKQLFIQGYGYFV